jgi:hypothetical protein
MMANFSNEELTILKAMILDVAADITEALVYRINRR